jgi:hypothetical protein
LVYVAVVSVFDAGDWEEVGFGILGDGINDFIVTDLGTATHRRYRNRVTGEVITDRLRGVDEP